MEFDADWVWFVVFAAVLLVRALAGLVSRARRKAEMQLPESRPGSEDRQELEPDRQPSIVRTSAGAEKPKPIEPR